MACSCLQHRPQDRRDVAAAPVDVASTFLAGYAAFAGSTQVAGLEQEFVVPTTGEIKRVIRSLVTNLGIKWADPALTTVSARTGRCSGSCADGANARCDETRRAAPAK